ncbi:hypothetical protein FF38_03561 [Lucilia cuprina]|uniref:Uncharacterized protein n=1 Tax=Lucilia cuprina TaxID=7375 RepID=A0A0L0C038_LUCCU|nr:hypothetical protein FF38_03561 [Lucilia cuprina]
MLPPGSHGQRHGVRRGQFAGQLHTAVPAAHDEHVADGDLLRVQVLAAVQHHPGHRQQRRPLRNPRVRGRARRADHVAGLHLPCRRRQQQSRAVPAMLHPGRLDAPDRLHAQPGFHEGEVVRHLVHSRMPALVTQQPPRRQRAMPGVAEKLHRMPP